MRSRGSQHEMREQRRREKREAKVAQKQQASESKPGETFIEKIKGAIVAGSSGQSK
ncbi:MAG: hypothetical protein WA721_14640 [Candidatus Binataceae bacterium]